MLASCAVMDSRSSEAQETVVASVEGGPSHLPSRALVVDDSMVVADVVTALLRRTGWTVDVANSVDAALEHVRSVAYDLVVCDVCMPDGGGPAV